MYYTITAGEVSDASNRELVVVCIHWVDEEFQPFEEFVGLHKQGGVYSGRCAGSCDKGYTPSYESGIRQLPRPMLQWDQQHGRLKKMFLLPSRPLRSLVLFICTVMAMR